MPRHVALLAATLAVLVAACGSDAVAGPSTATATTAATSTTPTTTTETTTETTTTTAGVVDPGGACDQGTALPAQRGLPYLDPVPAGVDPDLVSVDVYPVELAQGCGGAPMLLWVHGGGWRIGDKANNVDDKRAWAAAHGWLLVSVNYRLTPAVTWPTHNDDVAAAVAWAIEHGAEYGGDADRLALMGHSAGGGIVSGVSTNPQHLDAVGLGLGAVDCTVSLDTEGYDVEGQAAGGEQLYLDAFGTDPAAWAAASPMNHLTPGDERPPFLVVTRGLPRRIGVARAFADALVAAGGEAEVVEATGYSHAEVNDAVGRAGETLVTEPVTAFLDDCFAG